MILIIVRLNRCRLISSQGWDGWRLPIVLSVSLLDHSSIILLIQFYRNLNFVLVDTLVPSHRGVFYVFISLDWMTSWYIKFYPHTLPIAILNMVGKRKQKTNIYFQNGKQKLFNWATTIGLHVWLNYSYSDDVLITGMIFSFALFHVTT